MKLKFNDFENNSCINLNLEYLFPLKNDVMSWHVSVIKTSKLIQVFRLEKAFKAFWRQKFVDKTGSHAHLLYFLKKFIIRTERAQRIMDLGPKEKFLKFWELSQNHVPKPFAEFFVQLAAPSWSKIIRGIIEFYSALNINRRRWYYRLCSIF